MSPQAGDRPARLAVLDVGTNSTRLVVAEVEPGGSYRVLDEQREQTRLGEGLYETGRLTDAAIRRSLEAIERMKAVAGGFGIRELRVVATSAVREAENGREFIGLARERHGVRVEAITAEEEAPLAFRSARRHFQLGDQPVAVVDIGGGSTEVVLARGTVIDRVHSMPLGAVRLTERYVRSDPPTGEEWKALDRFIRDTIDGQLGEPSLPTPVMIGSGGTFTTLAAMSMFEREAPVGPVQGYEMTPAEVQRLLGRLRRVSLQDRRRLPGLAPERADIILAGAAVVFRLARYLSTRRILVNDRGIRDGLLLSLLSEPREPAAAAPRDAAGQMEGAVPKPARGEPGPLR